jgi:hypothetical protein
MACTSSILAGSLQHTAARACSLHVQALAAGWLAAPAAGAHHHSEGCRPDSTRGCTSASANLTTSWVPPLMLAPLRAWMAEAACGRAGGAGGTASTAAVQARVHRVALCWGFLVGQGAGWGSSTIRQSLGN